MGLNFLTKNKQEKAVDETQSNAENVLCFHLDSEKYILSSKD